MPRFRANRPVLVDGLVLMPGIEFEASDAAVAERTINLLDGHIVEDSVL